MSVDLDSFSLSSAIILFSGLLSEVENITVTNPMDFTISTFGSLPNNIQIAASPSAPISSFQEVLRSVTYTTTRALE